MKNILNTNSVRRNRNLYTETYYNIYSKLHVIKLNIGRRLNYEKHYKPTLKEILMRLKIKV